MDTTYLPPGEGQHYPMIDGDHVGKATVRDAQGSFEVFEVLAHPAPPAPPHVSPWTGVLFLVEGRVTFYVDGESYDVEPGGVAVLPAGSPGTFEVVGGPARFVAITSGNGAGRFFADFAGSVPADRPPAESMSEIMAVTGRHGVRVG